MSSHVSPFENHAAVNGCITGSLAIDSSKGPNISAAAEFTGEWRRSVLSVALGTAAVPLWPAPVQRCGTTGDLVSCHTQP